MKRLMSLLLVAVLLFSCFSVASAELVEIDSTNTNDGQSKIVCTKDNSLYLLTDNWLWHYEVNAEGDITPTSFGWHEETGISKKLVCGANFLYTLSVEGRINLYTYFTSTMGPGLSLRSSLYVNETRAMTEHKQFLITVGGVDGLVVYLAHETGVLIKKDSDLGYANANKIVSIWSDDNFIYVGYGNLIYTYEVSEDGNLLPIDSIEFSESVIGIYGDNEFLYVVVRGSGIQLHTTNSSGSLSYHSQINDSAVNSIIWSDEKYIYSSRDHNVTKSYVNVYNKQTLELNQEITVTQDWVLSITGNGKFIFFGKMNGGVSSYKQAIKSVSLVPTVIAPLLLK
jgi:hypothetical protein